MENEIVNANTTNGNETAVESHEPIDDTTADIGELKQKNQELYELYRKAKGDVRGEDGKWIKKPQTVQPAKAQPVAPQSSGGLSTEDFYALTLAKVPQEDIEEVSNYARYKGISIKEALNTTVLKTQLIENAEKRFTASGSSTGNSRRVSSRLSPEEIINRAERGDLPDDVESLAKARMERMKQK